MEGETELESFRQQWCNEVSARNQGIRITAGGANPQPSASGPGRPVRKPAPAPPPILEPQHTRAAPDGYEPYMFEDLEDKEGNLKLGNQEVRHVIRDSKSQPQSALELYEKAVERENQGSLGDSVSLYRKAFKVCTCSLLLISNDNDIGYCSLILVSKSNTRRNISRLPLPHLNRLTSILPTPQ